MKIKTYKFSKKNFFKYCKKLINKNHNSQIDKLNELECRIITLESKLPDTQISNNETIIGNVYWFYNDNIENGEHGILQNIIQHNNNTYYFNENNIMYLNCIHTKYRYDTHTSPSS
jgi:hypothetical protein